jgi:hypothetical protein
MTGHRRSGLSIALAAFVASLAVACSSTASAPRTEAVSSPTTSNTPSDLTAAVPTEVSDFPDGVYRTELTQADLQTLGVDDLGMAGIWTLTVESGTYQLDCHTIADPGADCANNDPSVPEMVEIGTLRGASPTVWFVHDMARKSELTGCVRHSQAINGCGPEDGFHLNWREVPEGIVFSDYVGLGDEAGPALANWIAQPWTRIS